MSETTKIPNPPTFRWYPKHLNHIAENIVFKNRNVSFLAINALFRQRKTHYIVESEMENGHFLIEDFVPLQLRNAQKTTYNSYTGFTSKTFIGYFLSVP